MQAECAVWRDGDGNGYRLISLRDRFTATMMSASDIR